MKTKFIIPSFAFYDRTGIQRYLEKQAAKGWLLEKTSNFFWRFRRMEPKKLHFCVTYFPHADIYDPEPSEEEETFRAFCAHGGWTLAGANAQMQIFYTASENPLPIETDPVIEVKNIHKSMKKSILTAYWLLVVNCLIQFANQGLAISNGLVNYLSSGMNIWLAATWVLLFVLSVSRLAVYFRWYAKAKRAAENDGVFMETRSIMWAEHLASLLIFGSLTVMILTMKDRRVAMVMGACMALAFALVILIELFRRLMKRMGFDAADSKKYTLIATVVLALVLCFGAIPVVTNYVMNNAAFEDDKAENLHLTISDLLGEEANEHKTMLLTDNESLLLGYQRVHQYPGGSLMDPNLEYNLVEVKAKFLYDKCLEEMMAVPVYMPEGVFHTVDPAPWGAEDAWQLHNGDEFRNWYVLCYEDYILEIIPSWEMNAAQMETVGEIFG